MTLAILCVDAGYERMRRREGMRGGDGNFKQGAQAESGAGNANASFEGSGTQPNISALAEVVGRETKHRDGGGHK
jgi:hypothetical protein